MQRYRPGTALLVVDVQNDLADPRGSSYVRGAEDVIPVVHREVERASFETAIVIYTQDWHPAMTPHFRKDGGSGNSGFSVWDPGTEEISSTTLAPILQQHAVERLVIVGLTTEHCVVETALDGLRLGFEVTVLTQAIRPVSRRFGDGLRAIERMREAGAKIVE